ncbi:hypothetical protein ACGFLS_01620 [Streptomyces abikoensis]|uniref:hypothetical protein n=1 Tax=Streptomyces abikoensis TaxID=97398 RepID=UPI00371A03F9
MRTHLHIGVQDEPLALAKAERVRGTLAKLRPPVTTTLVLAPARTSRTGTSVNAIEQALLDGRCDVAVRHVKDMPAVPLVHQGTVVAAYPRRGDVGALILASHALDLLDQEHRISEVLPVERPPLGAAATALQCRNDDEETIAVVGLLDDTRTRREIEAERMLRCVLRAGGHVPSAGFCTTRPNGQLSLRGVLFQADGGWFIVSHQRGTNSMDLGIAVGFELFSSRFHHLFAARAAQP